LKHCADAPAADSLVTSKTRAEVMPIFETSAARTFIVENGGAIYMPRGYFPFRVSGAMPAARGWLRITSTPRQRLIRALARGETRRHLDPLFFRIER
jgi:hypothetical protein